MKVEIENRGPRGEPMRVILEPEPGTTGCINLRVVRIDYSNVSAVGANKVLEAEIVISIEDLKAGVDSLARICKRSKG